MGFDSRNPENLPGGVAVLDDDPHPTAVAVAFRGRRHHEWSSAGLVAAARNGDRRAWDALVDRYAGLVLSVAARHRLDTHDANDVAQITWLRLTQHLHRLDDPERVGLWLHTTARRECLAVLSRQGKAPEPDDQLDATPGSGPAPDEVVAKAEQASHLRRALGSLATPCRNLLELMLVRDPPAPYAEISETCHIAVGTIGPRRKRCLEQLRRLYVELHPGLDQESLP